MGLKAGVCHSGRGRERGDTRWGEGGVVRGGGGGGVPLTGGLIVIDTDAFQLQVRVAHVVAAGVYAMLIADHLPELRRQVGRGGTGSAPPSVLPAPVPPQPNAGGGE